MLLLQEVHKTFRQPDGKPLHVLHVPHYELKEGEQAALMGRSGGGKTTLLHIISGITRPDVGSKVQVAGIELTACSEWLLDVIRAQRIGYVFQTFNLLPAFTALENVLLAMTFARRGSDPVRAKQLLERVGLGLRLHHKPRQLSVGEQQRVNVARAIANKPSLLLADEPTANVDPRNQQVVVDLIRETCREENIALLMVTHAPEVAQQFSRVDRLDEINKAWQENAA